MAKFQKDNKSLKEIIFLDGDGTLWYPKETKHMVSPHWIYKDKHIGKDYLRHLTIIPSVNKTLSKLKKHGIVLVLLSTHPHSHKKATQILKIKVEHFKLSDFFEEYHATPDNPDAKGNVIAEILKRRHVRKSKALMVGDSYRYDYVSARKVGVEALLLETKYTKYLPRGKRPTSTIKNFREIIDLIL
jgi:magnesium-dependent phosphatase-1